MPQFININDTVQLSSLYDAQAVVYQAHEAFTDCIEINGVELRPLLLGPSLLKVLDSDTFELMDEILVVVVE